MCILHIDQSILFWKLADSFFLINFTQLKFFVNEQSFLIFAYTGYLPRQFRLNNKPCCTVAVLTAIENVADLQFCREKVAYVLVNKGCEAP